MIELKKNLLKKAVSSNLIITDSYITNGHFCLSLSTLSPKTLLDIKELQLRAPEATTVRTDEYIEKIYPLEPTTEFKKTSLIMEDPKTKKQYRYYENDDKKFVTIAEDYVLLLNIETLHSSGKERTAGYINNKADNNIIIDAVMRWANPDAFTAFEETIKNLADMNQA